MSKTFQIENQDVPNYIMQALRQRRELDEDDTSEDESILAMSGYRMLDEWLKWEGIIGYTGEILDVILSAYGIDLAEYPFDEPIQRTTC